MNKYWRNKPLWSPVTRRACLGGELCLGARENSAEVQWRISLTSETTQVWHRLCTEAR